MINIIFLLSVLCLGISKKTLLATRAQYKFLLCVKYKTKEYKTYIHDINISSDSLKLVKLGLLSPQTATMTTNLIIAIQNFQDARHILFLTNIGLHKYCSPHSDIFDLKNIPFKGSLAQLFRDLEGLPITNSSFRSIYFKSRVTNEKVTVEFNTSTGDVSSDVKEITIEGMQ